MATTIKRKEEEYKMISKLLKEHRGEIYSLAQKSSQGKSLLKQLDNIWMKIEKLIVKEMK
jgi:hypothetical protein